MVLAGGLLIGCVQKTSGDYCDVASPLYFENQDVVDYLLAEDRELLRGIVTSNETWAALCGARNSR